LLTTVNAVTLGFRYAGKLMNTFRLDLDKLPISTEALAVYQPQGRISLETVPEAIQKLRAEPAQHMILDLSKVNFLDSAGIGSLVSLFVNRRSHGKTFALAALTQQGNAVVTVAGLQNLLPIHKTLEDALTKKP
jgi:anti-sigma B factor antagonist